MHQSFIKKWQTYVLNKKKNKYYNNRFIYLPYLYYYIYYIFEIKKLRICSIENHNLIYFFFISLKNSVIIYILPISVLKILKIK